MSENQENEHQLNIELTEEVADNAQYCNLAVITHSNIEFVLDFIQVMPGLPKAKVKHRTILAPYHAKRLLAALSENIRKYESVHGEISVDEPGNITGGFGGPTAMA